MADPELVCPQCGLASRGVVRCPECGAPLVPESALRLRPGREADESSYAQVVPLRDPFEGGHLAALLESRRIPVMIRGGSEAALAAGWVDHRGPRHGELMVPEGRLAEAQDLVTSFRAEIDRAGSISEDELAEVSERAQEEIERSAGKKVGPPPELFRLARETMPAALQIGVGVLILVQAAIGIRSGRFFPAAFLFFLGSWLLRRVPPTIVVDARERQVRVHTLGRFVLGRGPRVVPWGELARVSVQPDRRGARVVIEGPRSREGDPSIEVIGVVQKSEKARAEAERLARFMAIPCEPAGVGRLAGP